MRRALRVDLRAVEKNERELVSRSAFMDRRQELSQGRELVGATFHARKIIEGARRQRLKHACRIFEGARYRGSNFGRAAPDRKPKSESNCVFHTQIVTLIATERIRSTPPSQFRLNRI
jgi:hypothetical protein